MNPAPNELSGIPSKEETLHCYSGLYSARARVYYPEGVDQLRLVFAYATQKGRRVTFRAGGHSFDAQSLGDDLVVSMQRFNAIDDVQPDNTLRVGAGATWGSILAKLEPLGFLPAVTVTTCHATAGGTLAGDCLSRFSPAYGKEGKYVTSFKLLTLDGQLRTCTRPRKNVPQSSWTPEERAFCGVVAGLGYLGAVTEITYELLALKQKDDPIGVETRVQKLESFADLAQELVPATQKMYAEDSDPNDPTKHDAIYSVLYARKRGPKRQALLLRSTIKPRPNRRRMRRMLLFRPKFIGRIPVEWMMRRPLLCRWLWRLFFRIMDVKKPYMNELDGYTFFMDGNARAKKLGKRFGFKMQTIQQTFVVPFDPKAEDRGDARDGLTRWLEHAHQAFQTRKLAPTLWDVLFLPEDELFLMSATTELAGFAISFAFETSNRRTLASVKEAFRQLSDDLLADFGGRVYLVKNVHASQATLRDMYGQNALDFVRLKRDLDPHCIFRNEFLERTFGDLLECDGAPQPVAEEHRTVTGRFRRAPEEEREPARGGPEP